MDIRNSPLDKYAGMLGRVLVYAKDACDSAGPFGIGSSPKTTKAGRV